MKRSPNMKKFLKEMKKKGTAMVPLQTYYALKERGLAKEGYKRTTTGGRFPEIEMKLTAKGQTFLENNKI